MYMEERGGVEVRVENDCDEVVLLRSQSFFEEYIPGKMVDSVFEADFLKIYDLSLSCFDTLLGTPSAAALGKV